MPMNTKRVEFGGHFFFTFNMRTNDVMLKMRKRNGHFLVFIKVRLHFCNTLLARSTRLKLD